MFSTWRLSKLDNLEILYHETEYSLSLLLRLHNILKDKRITRDKDISNLIELANDGLPNLRARFEELLNQVATLDSEKAVLRTEILGMRNSICTNNEIINRQNYNCVRSTGNRVNYKSYSEGLAKALTIIR